MQLKEWQNLFLSEIQSPLSNRQRIYQACLQEAKIDSLKKTFPSVLMMIGEDAFEQLSQQFLISLRCESPDIGMIGETFSTFLCQHKISQQVPYLYSLAEFEWDWQGVFNSNPPDFNANALSQKLMSESYNAILAPVKNISLKIYDYAVMQLWACCQPEYAGDYGVASKPCKTAVLLYRESFLVKMIETDIRVALFFQFFDGRQTLQSIYEKLEDERLVADFEVLFKYLCELRLLK